MKFDLEINVESIVTLTVGIFAFVIYRFGKADERQKAAIIVLSEIRQAELAISELRKNKTIGDFTSVMPVNRWQENKHLFARYFDQDEFGGINNFYQSCMLIEEKVSFVKKSRNISLEEKFRILQQMRSEAYRNNPPSFDVAEKYLIDDVFATPNKPIAEALKYADTINFIIGTTIGAKLKHIIDYSWYKPWSWF